MRKIVCLVIMVAIAFAGGPSATAAERLSVPGETRQNEASLLLYEVYGAKLDSKDAMTVKGLVADLLEQAKDPSNDAAMRYVILKTAAEKAADVGDVATTLATTAQIVAQFKTKTGEIELRAIGNAAKAAKTAGEHGAVARDYINLVFQAIKADDYATAKEAAKLAGYASRKAKDKEVYDKTKDLGKIVRETETLFFAARSAFKALKDNPDDPSANLAFGRYMCFVKGDWDTGLTHLEKGSDKALAELAAKDFGDLDDPQEFLSLADAWWALGEKHGAPEQEELFGRARKYYAKALPHLSGLNKVKAEKRLEGGKADNGEKVISFFDDYEDIGGALQGRSPFVIKSIKTNSHVDGTIAKLASRNEFKPPLTLHLIAKTDSKHLRLGFSGGVVSLRHDGDPSLAFVIDPAPKLAPVAYSSRLWFYASNRSLFYKGGNEHKISGKGAIDRNKFVDIQWIIGKDGHKLLVNGEVWYEGTMAYDDEIIGKTWVSGAYGSVITIKKFEIILPNGSQQ